jgi:hypothetical protein
VIRRWWFAFAEWFGATLDEVSFRLVLAWAVVLGRCPRQVERRRWNRSLEIPILVDAHDWTDGRLLFSILVWPSLEDEDVGPSSTASTRSKRRWRRAPRG